MKAAGAASTRGVHDDLNARPPFLPGSLVASFFVLLPCPLLLSPRLVVGDAPR